MKTFVIGRFQTASFAFVVTSLFPLLSIGQVPLSPHTMRKIAQVDPRFVSYNVEAVEVTGGRFWKPFKDEAAPVQADAKSPAAIVDPYEYRGPIDLSSAKIRKLARALGPSYLRVSGTWMNSTYFQDDDAPALAIPPKGFKGVLTRSAWKGVVDFANSVGANLVTSVAMSAGTRDTSGAWTPTQAKALFDYTKTVGGHITAAEFMNEPTFANVGGAPSGYDAAAFARDAKLFHSFLLTESPKTLFLGPGSIGEGVEMVEGLTMPKIIDSEDMLKATGPIFDVFSYHFYTTLSQRCIGKAGLSWEKVLTPAYLDRNPAAEAFYAKLRDTYLPGKSIWNTETGEAGCGGDPWAAQFVDTFRYVDQMGILAQKNVQTVIVNTLAASEYGLLDTATLNPRPNYWAALLWKRTMGTRVLDPGIAPTPNLHVYAHCSTDSKGGVTLALLNLSQTDEQSVQLPSNGLRYTLSAASLLSKAVMLNGLELKTGDDGTLPNLTASKSKSGSVRLAPETITFIVLPSAKNASCD